MRITLHTQMKKRKILALLLALLLCVTPLGTAPLQIRADEGETGETAGAAETYLAHQLPDKAKAMATIVGLLALLLAFDWRLGLLSLVPVVLAFLAMTSMTGKKLQDKMTQY